MQIGEYIEACIQARGISKVKLTNTLGYNRTTFNNKIRDNSFTIPEYIELCNFLGIPYVQYFNQLADKASSSNFVQVLSRGKKSEKKKGSDSENIADLVKQNRILIEMISASTTAGNK
ncbi:hypothetical protein [Leadbetterella byssophila]|uniref:hypothetical protein n=1 Tax=Leadbetterella byssophila TaxID=316068 RepID=UPI0039A30E69